MVFSTNWKIPYNYLLETALLGEHRLGHGHTLHQRHGGQLDSIRDVLKKRRAFAVHGGTTTTTVDGRNPAPVEKLIDSLSLR